ncbi:MAG TPA: alcohol dehydrogenase catalytic domain-containing protein [Gaiellaceae bacterium]|nr:alcohol dehydrogenase catalytic domain-containing protein [Gaiellaceae bacterium]
MRAVALDTAGRPEVREIDEPAGEGALVRVLACGLCGSDVEKMQPAFAGAVLGHEVVGETEDGARVALVHHRGCGECERCLSGHESTCERFPAPTIRPGGFAERVRADAWIDVPPGLGDAEATALEPLACVLRGADAVPRGRVLVVGQGFVGRLFSAALEQRGDEVFAVDADPRRSGREPDGPVGAVVVCAPGSSATVLERVSPGGTILVFADAGDLPAGEIYRRELTVVGRRSATADAMRAAAALLPQLELPAPTVVPLERFQEGLDLFLRRDAAKVVLVP